MATSAITFRDLERDHEELKQSASEGPVFVVGGETPNLVVLSFADYERLRTKGPTPGEALSMPFGTPDEVLDFEFPKLPNVTPAAGSLADLLAVPEEEYFEWEPKPLRGLL